MMKKKTLAKAAREQWEKLGKPWWNAYHSIMVMQDEAKELMPEEDSAILKQICEELYAFREKAEVIMRTRDGIEDFNIFFRIGKSE